ncbi:glycerophosphodiester phosphodiesterase [Cohnella sp. CFH 77786]|uniref:phosphatidylinositol-specific phospholipase C/glycerophosphodiester phosphodiesterase family protein n=1 Tax=Cohnella sp. CFH 77786 TaxID=2662265 RepID=UPI001C610996|nr:phosphatidylinositol-specific phospholipase C/glycerophosphodiester phosphodiesterase family protein [Cohnella sp. CFH 77786]MBW5446996.1 glycerophosphodiester phosphodiesterase [Cohnella sp. CFH 77786]
MSVVLLMWCLLVQHAAPLPVPAEWTEHRMVAHAMGGIGGTRLTNSREAFVINYGRGFRVFEVDLRLTSDGYPVALHDWGALRNPVSLREFMSMPVRKKYHPLEWSDIVQLAELYPDVYFVTDTKERSRRGIERSFRRIAASLEASPRPDVRGRIVPQIYRRSMYGQLERIFPFPSYIYTLYDSPDSDGEVVLFLKRAPKIRAVTMPEYRVTRRFVSELKKLGVKIYVHSVNDPRIYETYRRLGVDGIYTDTLAPGSSVRQ